MFVSPGPGSSRRRRFLGRRVAAQPAPPAEPPIGPMGYEAQSQMLAELYRARRIDRPSYESARRRLQLAHGIGILPEARGREA
jgi:hypothetical protein